MKSLAISVQKALNLLTHHTETPLSTILSFQSSSELNILTLDAAKIYLSHHNEILLTSGAKLCFNQNLKGRFEGNIPNRPLHHTGWFIHGYAASGTDVDCYFDPKLYAQMVKYKQILPTTIEIGIIEITCCGSCPHFNFTIPFGHNVCNHPDMGEGGHILSSSELENDMREYKRATCCPLKTITRRRN